MPLPFPATTAIDKLKPEYRKEYDAHIIEAQRVIQELRAVSPKFGGRKVNNNEYFEKTINRKIDRLEKQLLEAIKTFHFHNQRTQTLKPGVAKTRKEKTAVFIEMMNRSAFSSSYPTRKL